MPSFNRKKEVHCSAEELFDVVLDIESYPLFLPWVSASRIIEERDREIEAELTANFSGITESFRTVDRFVRSKAVEIRLLDGPFRFLEGLWTFDALSDQRCQVHFSIQFEFNSRLLSIVATPVFSKACQKMVDSFEQRAIFLKGGDV